MLLVRTWTRTSSYFCLRRAISIVKPGSPLPKQRSNDIAASSNTPALSIVLAAVLGLPLALWAYKCAMMVLFQRKIIYMGYIPPGSRTEELSPDDPDLEGLTFENVEIKSDLGIVLRGYLFRKAPPPIETTKISLGRKAIIVYFQGNVGTPLHRLPLFHKLLLQPLLRHTAANAPAIDLEILAVPPRSYGRSTNSSPTESRLLSDYRAICEYATVRADREPEHDRVPVIFMGHSLGASIATVLLSQLRPDLPSPDLPPKAKSEEQKLPCQRIRCDGLIFENGFASIPGMVKALYPHKWLPYHHLGPLAFDHWDALAALEGRSEPVNSLTAAPQTTGNAMTVSPSGVSPPSLLQTIPILFISSEKDEMVPPSMMRQLHDAAKTALSKDQPEKQRRVRWLAVKDALHDFGWQKEVWGRGIAEFVKDVTLTKRKGS